MRGAVPVIQGDVVGIFYPGVKEVADIVWRRGEGNGLATRPKLTNQTSIHRRTPALSKRIICSEVLISGFVIPPAVCTAPKFVLIIGIPEYTAHHKIRGKIDRHSLGSICARFCSDENHPVGRPCSIQCRRSRTFQHVNRLNVVRVDKTCRVPEVNSRRPV